MAGGGRTSMLRMRVDAGSGIPHSECIPEERRTSRLFQTLNMSMSSRGKM